jgi:opacity protein-like surface antigen
MKKILLCFFLACSLSTFSQISWNAKAGVNISKITHIDADMKLGYQFGVGMDYYFSEHWGIQPSIMLITKGYKAKGDYNYPPEWNDVVLSKYNRTENRIYLEVPIMLAYRFKVTENIKLVLNGGAYVSYGIGGKYKNKYTRKDGSTGNDDDDAFSSGSDRFDVGLGAGTTFEYLSKYTIGIIGEWQMKNTSWNSLKNHTYGINLGYKF